ncbi:two-component regulator propeller domain-containing protein [Paraglaciecola aquimarina]|uniref:Two-component regulator propeller domain-containing protein n=1 Tax=Paraglaciecola aquimarina TaxID=1235557 RepID=A0ABU3T010_9ALTE|nr:two-component regulator propeller domain-containing protein [Paraglaciecola aquimarina]MDU0355512.1 two-component regulator propeller domain-containing protein [Paraglaciecola aquimarina]
MGTENGVYIVDSNTAQLNILNNTSSPSIAGKEVRSIIQDGEGKIWLGTTTGISILNADETLQFTYNDENSINFGLNSSHFYKLFIDSNKTIWLGTYSGGVYKHSLQENQIKLFESSPQNPNSLSGNLIWGIKEDPKGNIWIATQTAGLSLFDPKSITFKNYLKDFNHHIWSITIDDNNRLWIASSGGVFVYEQTREANLTLVKTLLTGQNILQVNYYAGKIWLQSNNNTIAWIDATSFSTHSEPLANQSIKWVRPIFLDSTNNLWLDTNVGILHYHVDSQKVSRLVLDFNDDNTRYFSKVIETETAFWLSSFGYGLIKIDKTNYELLEEINTGNGLSSNQVMNVIIQGRSLWVSYSNSGIDEVSLDSNQVLQNIAPEMLGFNELNESVGLLTHSQQLLFGGTNGFAMFEPEQLSVTSQINIQGITGKSKVPTITQLRVFNLPVDVRSANSPINAIINSLDEINLPYESNMLSFKFAQVNPVNPKAIKYRYKLKGLSDKWIETVSESPRYAHFSNLDFGTYQFIVQSKAPLTPWSNDKVLNINIAPLFGCKPTL